VDPSYLIQSNSGTVDPAANSVTPALPNATQDGSMLLLVFASSSGTPTLSGLFTADPPWFLDANVGGSVWMFRRQDQPAGESSWPISASSSTRWSWYIEEWAGMSSVSQPDSQCTAGAGGTGGGTFVGTIGSQTNNTVGAGTQCTTDVTDYRALSVYRAGGGSAIYPVGRSYSAGWSELAVLTIGDGSHLTDFQLMLADAYPGTTGTLDNTLTWDITGGGTYAEKTVNAYVAAYQPEPAAPPLGILTG
jgi:hypothetical protein